MPTYLSAFISHAHADNALCEPYYLALTQRGVACYYDRANPQTGHSLSIALQTEIEQARALIVMVSPAMLGSFWVEQEIDMFMALMAEDRARMLIPIKIAACEMPTRLRARWWLDATREPFAAIGDQLARALEIAPAASAASGQAGPFARIVDWRSGMGDHTTITAALAAAQPGERILVRKGFYTGGLTIDKPLELIGEGQPGDVEVHAAGADVIMFTASQGRVANLTLRQTGGEGTWYGVDIAAGRLELEDCDISSQSLSGVAIHDGAHPILRRNRIHDDNQSAGVLVYAQGQGLLEDNEIFANANSGVQIREGSAPTLRHNRIHDNKQGGVMVNEQGQGLLEDNDLFANATVGIEIREGGAPTLRRNRIHENGYWAIWAHDQGGGVFEGNDLRDNTKGPWQIDDDSKAKVTRSGNLE